MLRIPPFRVPITRLIICVFCGAWRAKLRLAFIFFVVLGEVIISPLKILRPHCRRKWAGGGGGVEKQRRAVVHRPLWSFVLATDSYPPRRNASQWLLGTFCHQKVQRETFLVQLFTKRCKIKDSSPSGKSLFY